MGLPITSSGFEAAADVRGLIFAIPTISVKLFDLTTPSSKMLGRPAMYTYLTISAFIQSRARIKLPRRQLEKESIRSRWPF